MHVRRICLAPRRPQHPLPPLHRLPLTALRRPLLLLPPSALPPLPPLTLVDVSHIVGDAIGTFVLVYCTLQWAHFRRLRKHLDRDDRSDDDGR